LSSYGDAAAALFSQRTGLSSVIVWTSDHNGYGIYECGSEKPVFAIMDIPDGRSFCYFFLSEWEPIAVRLLCVGFAATEVADNWDDWIRSRLIALLELV
jgi:hypothetical protein